MNLLRGTAPVPSHRHFSLPAAILPFSIPHRAVVDWPMPGMSLTPVSLLNRLKTAAPDALDWKLFEELYRPLIDAWIARVPGLKDEVSDISQEVFSVLVRELPKFDRRREGSFRAWLKKVTIFRTRAFLKTRRRQVLPEAVGAFDDFLARLQDPGSDLSKQWDTEHDRHIFRRLLAAIRDDFSPVTLRAFARTAINGQRAARVAEELKISENAVLLAKSRVLKRLRDEAAGLLD